MPVAFRNLGACPMCGLYNIYLEYVSEVRSYCLPGTGSEHTLLSSKRYPPNPGCRDLAHREEEGAHIHPSSMDVVCWQHPQQQQRRRRWRLPIATDVRIQGAAYLAVETVHLREALLSQRLFPLNV